MFLVPRRGTSFYRIRCRVRTSELAVDPYEAARLANSLREALVAGCESFVFETVFSDPAGDLDLGPTW